MRLRGVDRMDHLTNHIRTHSVGRAFLFLSNVSEVKVNISAPPTSAHRHDSWHEAQLRSHVKALEVH